MPFLYNVVDAHCDTIIKKDLNHRDNQFRVSEIFNFKSYKSIFAICPENKKAFLFTKEMLRHYKYQMRKYGLTQIVDKKTLKAQYGAVLALEGADALHQSLSSLRYFYNKGVRIITLTWNNNNAVAASIKSEKDYGLTAFGRKVVWEMETLGIGVDLSHIGDKGFFDVMEIATKPILVSHSNSRAINPEHKRNLSDEQFKCVIKNGGCAGVNFCVDFLGGSKDKNQVLRHIEHFCALGGERNVGIGTDFDGIDTLPNGCSGILWLNEIFEELLKLNYSEETVNLIAGGNFLRVLENIL